MPLSQQQLQLETNSHPMGRFQVMMVMICFILNFCDGIDILAVNIQGGTKKNRSTHYSLVIHRFL